MKKKSLLLAGLAIALFGGFTNAEVAISDLFVSGSSKVENAYQRLLTEYDSSRWYINEEAEAVTCGVDNDVNDLAITSPMILDGYLDEAPLYRLFVSKYRMDAIRNWEAWDGDVFMKDFRLNAQEWYAKIAISDLEAELDENQLYYAFIVPIDTYDDIGTPSKEICFVKSENACYQWYDCDALWEAINTTEPEVVEPEVADPEVADPEVVNDENEDEEHYAANCVGMDLANVTHITDGKTITLLWTAVDGDNVKIAIYDNVDNESYKDLGTTKMSNEKFVYEMEREGEHIFMLTNGCKEVTYKVDAAIEVEKEPEIVTPATWPAENIFIALIASIVLYGVYALFIRKNDN